jgi:peptidoglycan/xylan/chitin deacetylase (PgdA/CDA1 family)
MPGGRRRGMDHDIYPFSPLPERPPFRLPRGERVAFFVLLHLEYWELLPPEDAYRDPRFRSEFGNYFPEYRVWTYREYGARVGVFRVLDLLAELGLPVGVAVNTTAAERYRSLVAILRDRGYEPVAHGVSANRMITSRMSEEAERRHIAEARDRLAQVWGTAPSGWHGQDFGATERTSRLLAEAGFDYTLDWANDEAPYWQNLDRSLVAVPAQPDWDDVQTHWLRRVPIEKMPSLMGHAADRLLAEDGGARVLGIGLHPWMIGAPHRIRYLREALGLVVGRPGLRPMTTGEIASVFKGLPS